MFQLFYLCLDIGGTEIKLNILDQDYQRFYPEDYHYPSHAQSSKQDILDHFTVIIEEQLQNFKGSIQGIGFAVPGPFDYVCGISWMQGLGKYESLYQVNIANFIQQWLISRGYPSEFPICFENDAVAFALGEYLDGAAKQAEKIICLTLGTGCGSSFIEKGQVVRNRYGLPDNGMLYQEPFLDGVIEDYLSARGLTRIAQQFSLRAKDGLSLSKAAAAGSIEAKQVFHQFGLMIGTALQPYVRAFQPDCLVLGGQISKSFTLMKKGIEAGLDNQASLDIIASPAGSWSTYKGLCYQLNQSQK
ncbi:ROK family protein [Gracilibacillus alcaliphilus]|uniref:ROK family protein n=1 Tax=Gracilibacillus alcaliphilus TaxID=1401441 RepID=UPI00195974DF|nr:glucokinase [Gracilibacillus alcaliphilus]